MSKAGRAAVPPTIDDPDPWRHHPVSPIPMRTQSPPVELSGSRAAREAGSIFPFRFLLAGIAALMILNAGLFLPYQSLWIDETTQLSGIRLSVWSLFPWLAGQGPNLGVPDDCAPPISYLLQMGWGGMFGTSESAMRWFGVTCAYMGILFAATAALRAYGRLPAVAAALFLALSPNVMVIAVEIRSYPVFFMLACIATYLFVRVLQADSRAYMGWVASLTAVLLVAAYTHYFGTVLAGAIFLGLLVNGWGRGKLKLTLGFAAVFAVGSIGLAPFVSSALRMTESFGSPTAPAAAVPTSPARSVLQLGYRFFAHPAMAGSIVTTALTLVGALIAVGVALTPRRALDAVRTACVVSLGGGLLVVIVASFVLVRLRATSPAYNVWAFPLLALLLSRSVSPRLGLSRRAGTVGFALLLGGSLLGSIRIHRHPDAYAHGPQRRILALVSELGPEQSMVVYDQDSTASGHVFFPLRFTFGPSLPQYVTEGPGAALVPFDPADRARFRSTPRFAVVLRSRFIRAAELAAAINEEAPPGELILAAEALKKRGWRSVSFERRPSLVTTDIEVLEESP